MDEKAKKACPKYYQEYNIKRVFIMSSKKTHIYFLFYSKI